MVTSGGPEVPVGTWSYVQRLTSVDSYSFWASKFPVLNYIKNDLSILVQVFICIP